MKRWYTELEGGKPLGGMHGSVALALSPGACMHDLGKVGGKVSKTLLCTG